jgi:hypothetical protein
VSRFSAHCPPIDRLGDKQYKLQANQTGATPVLAGWVWRLDKPASTFSHVFTVDAPAGVTANPTVMEASLDTDNVAGDVAVKALMGVRQIGVPFLAGVGVILAILSVLYKTPPVGPSRVQASIQPASEFTNALRQRVVLA